jgi:hypothetical protein
MQGAESAAAEFVNQRSPLLCDDFGGRSFVTGKAGSGEQFFEEGLDVGHCSIDDWRFTIGDWAIYGVGVGVSLGSGVLVKVAVGEGVKVKVAVEVKVGVDVEVGVYVGVLVNVGVRVKVGVGVNVAVGVDVSVLVGV